MLKKLLPLILLTIIILSSSLVVQHKKIQALQTDKERLEKNQSLLLTEKAQALKKYKVQDSLNAVKVEALRLTLKELERNKKDLLNKAQALQVDKKGLQTIVDMQAETLASIKLQAKDSVIQEQDSFKCFSYISPYIDLQGCLALSTDSIDISIQVREELTIVESVKYKRFLGFLWKTNKVKSRSIDVLSANPHTVINSVNVVSLEP